MTNIRKNLGIHFRNGVIVLWTDIIKLLESTHISLKLAENYLNRMQEFVYYNFKFRSKYYFELNAIANMDETSLYLNMSPFTTVQKIKSKK